MGTWQAHGDNDGIRDEGGQGSEQGGQMGILERGTGQSRAWGCHCVETGSEQVPGFGGRDWECPQMGEIVHVGCTACR